MDRDTLQWILSIVFFVVFLAVMMRGCGGMMGGMGGCGMGPPEERRDRRGGARSEVNWLTVSPAAGHSSHTAFRGRHARREHE